MGKCIHNMKTEYELELMARQFLYVRRYARNNV